MTPEEEHALLTEPIEESPTKKNRGRWVSQTELGKALNLSKRKIAEVVAELELPHIRYSRTCLRYDLPKCERILKTRYGVHFKDNE